MRRSLSSVALSLLATVVLLVGCASTGDLRRGAGGSSFQVSGKSYDEVWNTAVEVVGRSLTIVESDKMAGTLKAEARAGAATWGEVVGVFISPLTPAAASYTVEVQSLKRMRTQVTGQDWEPAIVAGMKARLGL